MAAPTDARLRWVLADQSSERAVDPLGLGTHADQIADFLLPQLSGGTSRARYLSFFCWAVRKSDGSAPRIHRLEAELAIEEAIRHKGDPDPASVCPGVVGRSRAASYLLKHEGKRPRRAEQLYKNTAFATYRPTMRGLGLLARSRSLKLTPSGEQLATAFGKSFGRKLPCLGDITGSERSILKKLLGLDNRMQTGLPISSTRRRATYKAVKHYLEIGLDSASVLERHDQVNPRSSDVAVALHRAFVWELLSCGLTLAFQMLLHKQRKGPIVRALQGGLCGRSRRLPLGPLSASAPECAGQVVALLRAAVKLNPKKLSLDPGPSLLAERLVRERDPDGFLQKLVERHRIAKPQAPWITLVGDKVRILAPEKTRVVEVRPRTYRLDAFGQLLRDLGMIL